MSGDAFTRELFEWLNQVAADAELVPSAFKVAYVIGRHINRKSGLAWPGQQALADEVALSDRQIRTLVESLVNRGHLEVARRGGRGQPNVYRLAQNRRKPASGNGADKKPEAGFHYSDDLTGSLFPPIEADNRKSSAQKAEVQRTLTGSPVQKRRKCTSVEPSEEPSKEPSETIMRKNALDAEFAHWWKIYPRKRDRKRAQKTYGTARKKASADELLAGAQRYAQERRGEPEQYTKHASTWLNDEAWLNPPVATLPQPPSNHRRQVDMVSAMLATGYLDEELQ